VFTRGGPAGSDEPCDRAEAFKRFSQFQTLHAQLKSVQGYVNSGRALQLALPSLPPKTYGVRRFGHLFLEERRVELEGYLTALLQLPGVSYNPDFLAFVGLL